jgi:hypothetical protein
MPAGETNAPDCGHYCNSDSCEAKIMISARRPPFFRLLPPLLVAALAACSSMPADHAPGQVSRLPADEAARVAVAAPPAMTLDDIIARQRSGAAPDAIVARLRETGTALRLSAADVRRLNQAKVPDSVIDFILNSERSAAQEACAGELSRRDRELQSRLLQRDQDCMLRCNSMYPPFYSPFFPRRHYWWH